MMFFVFAIGSITAIALVLAWVLLAVAQIRQGAA
jgi:hypothetical protein